MKTDAIDAAVNIIGPVKSYAIATENPALQSAIDFSRSDLDIQRDTVLADMLAQLHDTVLPELPKLADYEVTAPMLSGFKDAVAAYAGSLGVPQNTLAAQAASTKAIKAAFADMSKILSQLDPLMLPKKSTDPEMYNTYTSNRKAGQKKALQKPMPKP